MHWLLLLAHVPLGDLPVGQSPLDHAAFSGVDVDAVDGTVGVQYALGLGVDVQVEDLDDASVRGPQRLVRDLRLAGDQVLPEET